MEAGLAKVIAAVVRITVGGPADFAGARTGAGCRIGYCDFPKDWERVSSFTGRPMQGEEHKLPQTPAVGQLSVLSLQRGSGLPF